MSDCEIRLSKNKNKTRQSAEIGSHKVHEIDFHEWLVLSGIWKLYVSDLNIYVSDLKIFVSDLKINVSDLKIYVSDLKINVSDLKIYVSDLKIYVSDFFQWQRFSIPPYIGDFDFSPDLDVSDQTKTLFKTGLFAKFW